MFVAILQNQCCSHWVSLNRNQYIFLDFDIAHKAARKQLSCFKDTIESPVIIGRKVSGRRLM